MPGCNPKKLEVRRDVDEILNPLVFLWAKFPLSSRIISPLIGSNARLWRWLLARPERPGRGLWRSFMDVSSKCRTDQIRLFR